MKPNTIIFILVTILILAGAYWYFIVDAGGQATLTTTNPPSAAKTQFDALVSELTPITFDTGIFSDPRFNALVNIATPVSQEVKGRIDPLATFSSSLGFAAPAAVSAETPPASEESSPASGANPPGN